MGTADESRDRHAPSTRDTRGLHALLREILACCRTFLIYPPTHSRIESQVARVHGECDAMLAAGGPLQIEVAGAHLKADEIDLEGDVARALSTQCKLRALRGFLLRPGLSVEEVRQLVGILAFEPGDARRGAYVPDNASATAHVEPLPWVGTGPWVHGGPDQAEGDQPAVGEGAFAQASDEDDDADEFTRTGASVAVPALLDSLARETARQDRRPHDHLLEELLQDEEEEPPPDPEDRVFEIDVPDAEELLGEEELQAILEEGVGSLEERFQTHAPERLAVRVLFRLLVLAPDEEYYLSRRDTFLRTLASPERLFDDLVRVLGRLLQDGSLWRFEPAPEFVAAVLDCVEGLATRVRLFAALPLRPEDARKTLRRWAGRADALPALARVLAARVAPEVTEEAGALLAQEADRDPARVEDWFRKDRRAALHPRVLHTLVTAAPKAAQPLCRRILERSPPAVVRRVTHLLVAQGTEEGLRMLTESLPKRRRGARVDLIRSVARFPHTQAILSLRAVLLQNNDKDMDTREVEAAATGLYAHELPAGRETLWEIAEGRTAITYRRPLRAIVEAILQGNPA